MSSYNIKKNSVKMKEETKNLGKREQEETH